MTAELLREMWVMIADGLASHLALIPDDLPGLDEPLWAGHFVKDGEAVDETGMSLRQLLVHTVVASSEVPIALATGAGFDPVRAAASELNGLAPSALAADYVVRRAKLMGVLDSFDDAGLAAAVPTPFGETAVALVLGRAALHAMHHKGQVSTAMRQLGVRTARIF